MNKKNYIKLGSFVVVVLVVIIFSALSIVNAYWSKVQYVEISKNDEDLGIINESTEIKKEVLKEKSFQKFDESFQIVSDAEISIENDLLPKVENEILIRRNVDLSNATDRANAIEEIRNSEDIVNIALFGIDSRNVLDEGRSDAMIIVSINFIDKKIKLMSFMRDMKVSMGNKDDKLGHAYAYGGGEFAIKTFNRNFGLDIREFATSNFYALADVVDMIGGLDLEVSESEKNHMNDIMADLMKESGHTEYQFLNSSGLVHMNGEQVVSYARIRKIGNGDYERTDRQREVLSLMFEKVVTKNPKEIVDLVGKALPLMATSMDTQDVLEVISRYVSSGGNFEIESIRFPSQGMFYEGTVDNISYIIPHSIDKIKNVIQNYIYFDIMPNQ